MSQSSTPAVTDAIYDASSLGRPRMFVLGLQHMFAMFGATVLVPVLTGLSVSATLLFAGIGTLLFHFLSRGKVPAFLGSSFAFIAGYAAIAPNGEAELLPYACLGVACAGLLYPVLAALFRAFGAKRVMRFFPPVVTGPIVISIGLILASSAIANCQTNWLVAVIAVAVIVICNIWGRGMVKIVPILLGVVVSYAVAAVLGEVDFSGVAAAPWVGLPIVWDNTVFALFGPQFDSGLATTAIITIMPLAFATMIEHIGDISAIGSTCERNYIADPGLHRTLLGDGLATILASLFGAPANTTYGENTGVLALTRVFDPRVIRIAACCAIVLSFCPKFAAAKFFHVCGIPLIPWDETRREVRPNEMEIPNRGAASGPAGSERGPAGCPFARAGRARCADRPDRNRFQAGTGADVLINGRNSPNDAIS